MSSKSQICACPGCNEIVPPPDDGGEFPLYHSKECRLQARKLRRASRREAGAAEAANVEVQPVEGTKVEAQPIQPELVQAEPAKPEPAKPEPAKAQSAQAEPAKAEPGQADAAAASAVGEPPPGTTLDPLPAGEPAPTAAPLADLPLVDPPPLGLPLADKSLTEEAAAAEDLVPAGPPGAPDEPGSRRRSAAGPGAHRAEPPDRRPWALAGAAGGLAVVVLVGVLVALNQGSGPSHPLAGGTSPAPSPGTSTAAASSPPAGRHHQPGSSSSRPVIVRVATSSPVPRTTRSSPKPSPRRSSTPSPKPSSKPSPRPTRKPKAVPTSFSALAGSGCPARSDAGTTVTQGWYNQSGGGWTGSGCSGAYVSKWDHPASYNEYRTFLWWFNPTLTGHVTCRVSVYIPSGSTTTVGSNPARYTVYTGPNGHAVGSFRINQRTHHARWVYEGTYPEQEKRFSVQVNNLGSGSVMVAADAVRVTCTH